MTRSQVCLRTEEVHHGNMPDSQRSLARLLGLTGGENFTRRQRIVSIALSAAIGIAAVLIVGFIL